MAVGHNQTPYPRCCFWQCQPWCSGLASRMLRLWPSSLPQFLARMMNIEKYNAISASIDNTASRAFNMACYPPAKDLPSDKWTSCLKYGRERSVVSSEIMERSRLGEASREARYHCRKQFIIFKDKFAAHFTGQFYCSCIYITKLCGLELATISITFLVINSTLQLGACILCRRQFSGVEPRMFAPLWRTKISPDFTFSPAVALTPSLFDTESRPNFVEPPAFRCAI